MRHKADIELTVDGDGLVIFTVIDPISAKTFQFSLLPTSAADLGAALLELGDRRSEHVTIAAPKHMLN